jgi:hypothetical protein
MGSPATATRQILPGEIITDKNQLLPGEALLKDMSLVSNNGAYHAVMQREGNFVVYRASNMDKGYASGTEGPTPELMMQGDGNLCMHVNGGRGAGRPPVWCRGADSKGPAKLVLTDDGDLVIVTTGGEVTWAGEFAAENEQEDHRTWINKYLDKFKKGLKKLGEHGHRLIKNFENCGVCQAAVGSCAAACTASAGAACASCVAAAPSMCKKCMKFYNSEL